MKLLVKLIVGLIFFPFMLLAAIIAVIRTIFTVTFVFAWQTGNKWHENLMLKLNDLMQWTKDENENE